MLDGTLKVADDLNSFECIIDDLGHGRWKYQDDEDTQARAQELGLLKPPSQEEVFGAIERQEAPPHASRS
jgi:hypothetical protein